MIRVIAGIIGGLAVSTVFKDEKNNPKSKEEIKENIRKKTAIVYKYTSAVCEIAGEKLNELQEDIKEDIKKNDYFKNINRKDNQ